MILRYKRFFVFYIKLLKQKKKCRHDHCVSVFVCSLGQYYGYTGKVHTATGNPRYMSRTFSGVYVAMLLTKTKETVITYLWRIHCTGGVMQIHYTCYL